MDLLQLKAYLRDHLDQPIQLTRLADQTYQASTPDGDFVVRPARDETHLVALRREARVQQALHNRITLCIPRTQIIAAQDDQPPLAIHRMIPGRPLTTDLLAQMFAPAYERLVLDLVTFFHQTHQVPLDQAAAWLETPFAGPETLPRLATTHGKPTWFGADTIAAVRGMVLPQLASIQTRAFEETVVGFAAVPKRPADLVFGHGDLHGFNMAVGQDAVGPKLVGIFDWGCTGILDRHEDFFRLSLVSEDLLDRVIETYRRQVTGAYPLDRERIALYYRAFLFYLMVGQAGSRLAHLQTLLQKHLTDGTVSRD